MSNTFPGKLFINLIISACSDILDSMEKPPKAQRIALAVTRGIGSPLSIIIHTILFAVSFTASMTGIVTFDRMLLVLTTIVSLEAIYLSIFIQMTINYTTASIREVGEDIEEIQEDVGELQEDVEEISEDASEDEQRDQEHQRTLSDIQRDLRTLMADIDRLKDEEDSTINNTPAKSI